MITGGDLKSWTWAAMTLVMTWLTLVMTWIAIFGNSIIESLIIIATQNPTN